MILGLVFSWSGLEISWFLNGFFLTLFIVYLWFSGIVFEATTCGCHSRPVQSGLRLGMVLFIVSEVIFFLAFFWAYLHCALSPNVELGSCWPPPGLTPLSWCHLPLLNTVLLLVSGATVTYSHLILIHTPRIYRSLSYFHSSLSCTPGYINVRVLSSSALLCTRVLLFTVLLGLAFLWLQYTEYVLSPFTIADSSYGSCFYLATGFHGLHVFIGCCFLLFSYVRFFTFDYTQTRHLGFLFAIWYWHFVDVVWLLLYLIIYCWGS